MRTLIITPSFHPAVRYGGTTHSAYALARGLAGLGCEVRVLTTNADGDSVLDVDTARDVMLADGLSVRYCPRIMPDATSPALLRLLPSYLRWADVAHVMWVYAFTTIPALAAAHLVGKPAVWSPRGTLQRWERCRRRRLKGAWDRVCRLLASPRTVLCFTSTAEAEESLARFRGLDSVVIPNGVEVPSDAPHVEAADGVRAVFLGRLHPIKGLENLLDGFALAVAEGLRGSLTLAGEGDGGYTRSLRDRISALGLDRHVSMIGWVDGDAKRALFSRADVLVIPSYRESFGIVVAEALAHGVPVIAARNTPWRCLDELGLGLWVDNDPASLAAALLRAQGMPLREMGRRGREWVARELTTDVMAQRTLALYRRLAA